MMSRDASAPFGSGAMFDEIAGRYDRLNRVISLGMDRRWRARLIEATLSGASDAPRVLDLATGTGDVAVALARAGALVTGVDPSEQMLACAGVKAKKASATIDFRVGDAQALAFPDNHFDAACIAFGIRNVPDRERGLREMARVTRPGGAIAVLELSEPRRGWLAPLARWHVHHVVPVLGAWLSGAQEYRYLQRSIAAFPSPAEFAEMMEAAGIVDTTVTSMTLDSVQLFVGSSQSSCG